MYSLEYTDISKMYFTPHHVGHCRTTVVRCYCYATINFNSDLGLYMSPNGDSGRGLPTS